MRLILSNEKGAEAVMHDFTARYSLVKASAQLHLFSLYAQGHRYHCIDDSEQERMNQFTEAMNDLLMAVYHLCSEAAMDDDDGHKHRF